MSSGVLVIYQRGRRGRAALAEGARLARNDGEELTVLALAPQDTDPAVCGVYTEAFNEGVRSVAQSELGEARRLLGEETPDATYAVLLAGRERALGSWVAAQRFRLVLLTGSGLVGLRRRRGARRLERAGGAEVRLL